MAHKSCRLAALVSSPDEARRALEAGADYVLAPTRRDRSGLGVPDRLKGDGEQTLYAIAADESLPSEPRRVRSVETPADPAALRGDAGGIVLLDPGRPILRAFSAETIANHIAACRAAGAECWLAGALELPDIPRLMALSPDVLVVEGFDEAALAQAGRMLRSAEAPLADAPTDLIRVTNFILQARVGAYGFERERNQRIRFSVEAAVRRSVAGVPRAMGDVYSYDIVMDAARRLCERGHTDLVETLAEELAVELLTDRRVAEVMVRVEKLDLGPEAVGIEIRRRAIG
ncbi:dihydroneopterin aldolase [Aureimonas phyllosphaerae]|uniref:(5-formylfuran-3-yl)methyl phosphate synthase n=1 Tax=Aureimonas phyllosphaerae TaxID=1166078 RepID=A0A7W6BQU1_9HYPH|nr:dihydroneopterin aldolase [Aureimonas phyllosphaerae]MBB3936394.1 dihydroneopterin aldolase [Aureimonas phyllosphaerae]MBB3960742.1 dihydroneopterin aldolase [Aureimonas phyllosphaerae]SFF31091.1 dihydroneopterin aldolase [Aureimonas phyllosphaerae]